MITIGTITFTGRTGSLMTPQAGELPLHPAQDGLGMRTSLSISFHNSADGPVVLVCIHFPCSVHSCERGSYFKEGRGEEGKEGLKGG